MLHERLPGVDERPRPRHHSAVLRRPIEADRERVRADECPQQEPVRRVVDETQIDVRIVHGRVATERVVADVESVVRT